MIDLEELKRLLAEYHQWDASGELISLDTSAVQRRQQIRLEMMNALPDLIAEIERLRRDDNVFEQGVEKWTDEMARIHVAVDTAHAAHRAQEERIELLEAALREICNPPSDEGTIMISREIAIARAALESKND